MAIEESLNKEFRWISRRSCISLFEVIHNVIIIP